jgi:hypothetical protein
MENIACETGKLLNGMFNFIRANPFFDLRHTYGYIISFFWGLSLLVTIRKVVYVVVKDK